MHPDEMMTNRNRVSQGEPFSPLRMQRALVYKYCNRRVRESGSQGVRPSVHYWARSRVSATPGRPRQGRPSTEAAAELRLQTERNARVSFSCCGDRGERPCREAWSGCHGVRPSGKCCATSGVSALHGGQAGCHAFARCCASLAAEWRGHSGLSALAQALPHSAERLAASSCR